MNYLFNAFLETDLAKEAQEAKEELTKVQELVNEYIPKVIDFVKMLVIAILIYFVGKKIIKAIVNLVEKALNKSNLDESVSHFLAKLCNVLLYLMLIIMVVGYMGLPTSSLVALLGSAGLAVGLALQGSLANFAGGVLILLMKPFKIGDYIITSGYEGVVTGIDVFYTKLTTGDNKVIVIPNGIITNASIQNNTDNHERRVDIIVPIEYQEDFNKVKALLLRLAEENDLVLKDEIHEPVVFLNEFAASSINVGFRVWAKTDDYWTVLWGLQENIKSEFDKNGISIPFDQLEIKIHKDAE